MKRGKVKFLGTVGNVNVRLVRNGSGPVLLFRERYQRRVERLSLSDAWAAARGQLLLPFGAPGKMKGKVCEQK